MEIQFSVRSYSLVEMGPNLEPNDPQEIFSVFDSLDGVFSETNEYHSSTDGQSS